jgi:hypothetical protein
MRQSAASSWRKSISGGDDAGGGIVESVTKTLYMDCVII